MDRVGVEVLLHGFDAFVELLPSQDPEALVEQGAVQPFDESVGLRPSNLRGAVLDLLFGECDPALGNGLLQPQQSLLFGQQSPPYCILRNTRFVTRGLDTCENHQTVRQAKRRLRKEEREARWQRTRRFGRWSGASTAG